MIELSAAEVVDLRLTSQLLQHANVRSPGEVVEWFGAMQAQDLASGKWSFGARLPHLVETDVDAAIEKGEVLRTWPMRGTIHFVPPMDAQWMLRTTGAKALRGAEYRRQYLGMEVDEANLAVDVLGAALSGGGRLTRAEAVDVMAAAGIKTAGQLAYHLLWYTSQVGVTCIGPNHGKEQTFVLLDEWAPQQRDLDREEGLALTALRFVRSHGPVPHQDLMRWADLSAKEAKAAIAANGAALVAVSGAGSPMWVTAQSLEAGFRRPSGVHVLPGFDEWMLGYKDRSLMLPVEHKDRIVPGGNGVFQPTLNRAGKVIGTWRRAVKRDHVTVTLLPFEPLSATAERDVRKAFQGYGRYTGLPVRFAA